MKKRSILFVVLVLAAIAVLILFYFGKGKRSETIKTTGIIEGIEANLSSKVSGRISFLCCNEGDPIKEGEVAVKLESDDLRASVEQSRAGVERAKADVKVAESAIENSKANIRSAEAEIKSSEADIERSRVQMEEAKRQLDRADALYKEEFLSKASLDLSATNYDTSVATYMSSNARLAASNSKKDAAVAQLNTSTSELNSARARFRESEANLSYNLAKFADTAITSPMSGIIVFKALESGEMVSPAITVLTIVDMKNLYARVDIDETFIDGIVLGSEAIIRAEGTPKRTFRGKVYEIGRYAEFATQRDVTRGRQDIKTFRVKIGIGGTGGVLKPGMTVDVEIPKKK